MATIHPPQTIERANMLRQQAETIRILADLGFDKERAVTAVHAGDLSKLTTGSTS